MARRQPLLLLLLSSIWHLGTCSSEHHWPNVRGLVGQYGVSKLHGPKNLSKPSWRWHHPDGQYHEVVVGGPVIDHEKNLYFCGIYRLIKLSPDGKVIWEVSPPPLTRFPDGPTVHGDGVFAALTTGALCKFRADSGQLVWCHSYAQSTGGDSKYVTSYDGVVIIGTDNAELSGGGSKKVVAIDADSGNKLWEYQPDTPTWNNMGMFTVDDTVVLQDWDARVYCLGLHNGSLMWKVGGSQGRTWSDGGTIIGANGIVYAAASKHHQVLASKPYYGGSVSAYRLIDGEPLWQRDTKHGVYTWPVAGQLHDDDRWSVVIASGAIPPCMSWRGVFMALTVDRARRIPVTWLLLELGTLLLCGCNISRIKCKRALARLGCIAILTFFYCCFLGWIVVRDNMGPFEMDITAYDAETGDVRWTYELPPWEHAHSRGDDEGIFVRMQVLQPREMCCPASFGSPSVDGQGVVYIGHASGMFYAIKDRDGNGKIDETEVEVFDAEAAFLHSGPAFAPGLFAFSTCDSVWGWRTDTQPT